MSAQEICGRCRNGRLLGEAVHDRDGGWRYFLSCYGCGTRTPLGAEAHRQLMDQSKVGAGRATPAASRPDRAQPTVSSPQHGGTSSFADHKKMCTHVGCTTRVSIYNASATCWAHS